MDIIDMHNPNRVKRNPDSVEILLSSGNFIQDEFVISKVELRLYNEQIDDIFICGPEQMILDVKAAMTTKGIPANNIHFELFHSGAAKTAKPTVVVGEQLSTNVTVVMDDDSVSFALDSNGMTILDAAYKAGSDVPYACKGGVCCTCKAKVLKGTVRMDLNYALTPEEVEAGYILTCQAHPTSEEVLVSFDD